MTAIARRGRILPISTRFILATDDDVNGVQDLTKTIDVTGASRVILWQERASGGDADAGIDVLLVSHDAGTTWAVDNTLLLCTSNDSTGTSLEGILNTAGDDPAGSTTATPAQFAQVYKSGPYEGPTCIRITRKTTTDTVSGDHGQITWTTGAPGVYCLVIGGDHAGGAPSTTLR